MNNFLAELYSANLIVGKTLIAAKPLIAYNLPIDKDPNKKELFKISPGGTVGIVESYLNPKANRNNIWWQFKKIENGKPTFFYVEHKIGNFNKEALIKQGTKTVEQEQPKEEEEIGAKIERYLKYAGFAAIGLFALNIVLKNYIKK